MVGFKKKYRVVLNKLFLHTFEKINKELNSKWFEFDYE